MKWTTDEFTGKRFGKYEVLCRLAIGGMAEIFLGFANQGPFFGRPVVIKRILNEQREDPNAMQMLLDEARNTATLMHPNVAQVIDLEKDDEEVLLVIEFINGCNLEELVEVYTVRQEPLPLGFAVTAIREAAQGLGHAHAHKNAKGELLPIVHRDVTPRNVMVDFDGAVKVLDFGIARAKGSERRTQAGMVRGTTAYMSPEQAVGKELDPRTDLFSLGTIFHELLTGQRLFYKGNPGQEMAAVYEGEIPLPSKVNRRVPKTLDNVVMRLLERKLEKRYQSALEMIRDLSLAAGSSAWSRERCAELVRNSFSARQSEVEKLLVRIPHRPPQAAAPSAPSYPEGRTIVSKAPQGPVPVSAGDDSGARTLVGAQPLSNRIPLTTEPGLLREAVTDPGRPIARPATPQQPNPPTPSAPTPFQSTPSQAGLSAEQLFDEEPEKEVRTRIIPGGSSMRSLPRVDGPSPNPLPISEQTTDPRRPAVRRGGNSTGTIIVAAVIALALGAVGGAFIIQKMQGSGPTQPVGNTLVRLQLSSDRPAIVFLGKQELGPTPISVFVPSGKHQLELREEGAPRRGLEVNLSPAEAEARLVVTLDSLPQLP